VQEVKLSDQLGAMAIIDELYQAQQLLLEHLDRDKLRNSLTEKIKNYYQAKGLIIDDKTINDGVNLWFDNRLRFNAPKRSWLQRFLIACYITRRKWFPIAAIILFIFFILIAVSLKDMAKSKQSVFGVYNHILKSKQSLDELSYELLELNAQSITYAQVSVKKLRASISELLNEEIIPPIAKPVIKDTATSKEIKDTFENLKQLDSSIDDKLSTITDQLLDLKNITEADHKLAQLINNEKFFQASKLYPVLQITADSIIDGLNSGQKIIDFSHLETLYNSIERASTLEDKIQADIKQLKALNVPDADMAPVTALQTGLQADLKSLNFDNVKEYHEMIAYYIKLAQTPLKLIIVDDADYKSGVERSHENTNGKSWYLIVRPVTPAGKNEYLWIKSIETGQVKFTNMFGVQVTQQAFNDVKADKAKDGHISDKDLCDKSIGHLLFECPSSVKSGKILEW